MAASSLVRWLDRALAVAVLLLTVDLLWSGFTAAALDAEVSVSALGLWGMRLILASYLLRPLADLLGQPRLLPLRRSLGLWGFGVGAVHAAFYIWSAGLWPDRLGWILRRPYLLTGLIAFVLLALLAATSPRPIYRAIPPRLCARLHALIHPALVLLVLHELLYDQDSIVEAVVHAGLVALGLASRLPPVRGLARRGS